MARGQPLRCFYRRPKRQVPPRSTNSPHGFPHTVFVLAKPCLKALPVLVARNYFGRHPAYSLRKDSIRETSQGPIPADDHPDSA
jgi:hypothetical protein